MKTIKTVIKENLISLDEVREVMLETTYYNTLSGRHKPTTNTIKKFCKLLNIDKKEFKELYKNTIKNSKK